MNTMIHCVKCNSLPYDILMMNCNHHLCIKCAVSRVESKTIGGRVSLQCEKCKGKTNLDEQSMSQLEKVKKIKNYSHKYYIELDSEKRTQTPLNAGRQKILPNISATTQPKTQKQPNNSTNKQTISPPKIQLKKEQQTPKQKQSNQKVVLNQSLQSKSLAVSKLDFQYGQCEAHAEEPVMYYCLTCRIHCFCAQCVLKGKHSNHDVKVIKKAYLLVEKQFIQTIQSTKKFISKLFQINKQMVSSINTTKNSADGIKKNIQKSFDQIRASIRQKQLQFMKIVDQKLNSTLAINNGIIKKTVQNKLKQQQDMLGKLQNLMKRGEKNVLNFYSDSWEEVQNVLKNQEIIPTKPDHSFSVVLVQYITALQKQIEKVQIKYQTNL